MSYVEYNVPFSEGPFKRSLTILGCFSFHFSKTHTCHLAGCNTSSNVVSSHSWDIFL